MCRLLVWTVDQDRRRAEKDKRDDLWKRGDTVAVVEDDGVFGTAFDGHPCFRIIEMPGVPAAKYHYLTSPETEMLPDPFNPEVEFQRLVRKCLFKVDIDAMEAKEVRPAGEKLTSLVEADLAPVEKQPLPADEIVLG